jgi:hypothetical protein
MAAKDYTGARQRLRQRHRRRQGAAAEPEIADYIEAERPVSKYLDPAGVDAAAIVVAVRGQRFEFFNAHR